MANGLVCWLEKEIGRETEIERKRVRERERKKRREDAFSKLTPKTLAWSHFYHAVKPSVN